MLAWSSIALPAGSTDLLALSDAGAGAAVWSLPAHWIAVVAFALVVLVEIGRQPIDNPDTHLELTMIHEGPLLEYAGRDLAYLQWAAAARHWVMLVLTVELLAPRPVGFVGRLVVLAVGLPVLCVMLAVVETWLAKMRLLRVPRLLAVGHRPLLSGLGHLAHRRTAVTEALSWGMVALGLFVVITRRRTTAIGLIALQALLLGVYALTLAPGRSTEFLIAGLILLARTLPLCVLLAFSVRRTREARPLRSAMRPLLRLGLVIAAVFVVLFLAPSFGLTSRVAEQASREPAGHRHHHHHRPALRPCSICWG